MMIIYSMCYIMVIAWKHIRDTRNFNNIVTQALIKFFFPARQGTKGNSRHSDRNNSLCPSWSG